MAIDYDLVIVGKGISGLSVLYEVLKLSQKKIDKPLKIAVVGNSDLAPICSLNSTAFVSHEAITRGVSILGDYLLDGFDHFKTHYSHFDGVEKITQTRFIPNDENKKMSFQKRYQDYLNETGECAVLESYVITPQIFLESLTQKIKNYVNLKNDLVLNYRRVEHHWELYTHSGQTIKSKNIVFAMGAMGHYFFNNLPKSSQIVGHYIEFSDCDYGDNSFVMNFENKNIIYRCNQKTLQISGFKNFDDECFMPPSKKEMEKLYHFLAKKIKLPSLETATVYSGLREKAQKRLPYQKEIDSHFYVIGGGYKNGWTLMPLMSHQLAKSLIGKL